MFDCTVDYDVGDFEGRSYYRVVYSFFGYKRPHSKFFDNLEEVMQFEEENKHRLQRFTVMLDFYQIVLHYRKEEANE